MRLMLRLAALVLAVFALSLPATASSRAIVILDASGSMWAQIEGKTRIEIARDTLKEVLSGVAPDLELGFMAYGHRTKGDCADIELMVPPAAGTADSIAGAAMSLNPRGKTPLSDAVRQAAEELKYTEDQATVVLITDGIETCEADPCALATELEAAGVDFTVNVVGFGLSKEDGATVQCLADLTGGTYISADDEDGLKDAIDVAVNDAAAARAGARARARAGHRHHLRPHRDPRRRRRSAGRWRRRDRLGVHQAQCRRHAGRVGPHRIRHRVQGRDRARRLHRRRPARLCEPRACR